jgi:hypothetical protein
VADRASALLGRLVGVEFRIVGGAGALSPSAEPDPVSPSDDELPIPDRSRLLEAPHDAADPLSLLQAELGAEEVNDPDAD